MAIIQGSPLFAALPPLAHRKLASNATLHTFHSGETIVRQGEKVEHLTVVADGLLKVLIMSPNRSQAILELLRPGDVFGLESCINQIATSAALEALSECETLHVERSLVEETLRLSPRFAQAALSALSATINRRTLQVSDLVFLELHQRLAKLLLGMLPATAGNEDSQLVTLRLPMQQLAQVVGAEPSAVREVMDTFQELGYIERVEGRGIRIRRREHLNRQLAQSASWAPLTKDTLHDTLTGLPNQAYFRMILASATAAKTQGESHLGAVLFIDLDDFKRINDTMGHGVGDELLIEVGRRIRACVRTNDTAARFSGDEFGVLLDGMSSQEEATHIAQRIVESLSNPYKLGGRVVITQASVGIAMYMASEDASVDAILHDADQAMYAAKSRGKGRFVLLGS